VKKGIDKKNSELEEEINKISPLFYEKIEDVKERLTLLIKVLLDKKNLESFSFFFNASKLIENCSFLTFQEKQD